jgi:hypothetical protein
MLRSASPTWADSWEDRPVWAALGGGLLLFTKPCRAVRCQFLISTTERPCALTNSAMPRNVRRLIEVARRPQRLASRCGRANRRIAIRMTTSTLHRHPTVIEHRDSTMIVKICAYAALVLVAALGTLQAAPIASPPADLIRDDVSKAWWGDCWRDRGGRAHCRRCWYGARGQVHCTRDSAPPSSRTAA